MADLLRGKKLYDYIKMGTLHFLRKKVIFWCCFDFILGDAALLEAAKKGNLARVQKLASQENINCRDTQGRNSTPLHLAGIYYVSNIFILYLDG